MARVVTKEELDYFAKCAADNYINKGKPMNDTINEISDDNQYLNKEHLKRIIEGANSNVYKHMYDNSDDKVIDFEVADPNKLLMEDTIQKVAYDTSSYFMPPKKAVVGGTVKTAELVDIGTPVMSLNRCTDIKDDMRIMKDKLAVALDELELTRFSHERHMNGAYTQLYKLATQLLDDGIPFSSILHPVVEQDPQLGKDLTEDMTNLGNISTKDLTFKKEGSILNTEHRLYKLAMTAKSHKQELHICKEAIKEGKHQLNLLEEIINGK